MRKYTDIVVSFSLGALLLWLFTAIAGTSGWATYDLGITQKLFLAAAELPIIIGITKLYFALSYPVLFRYIDKDFDENKKWNALTDRERTLQGLLLWRWYLLCFVLLVALQ
jgi:hypothetical protein